MGEEMTDKQLDVILNLVADKFAGCKDMNEVKKAIEEVRNMSKKEKPIGQALGHEREGGLAAALNQKNYSTQVISKQATKLRVDNSGANEYTKVAI